MNKILDNLKEIASAVMYAAQADDLEQVLERIAQISAELVNARYAALGVPDDKGGLQYFKVAGMSPEALKRLDHLPKGLGLLGALLKERKVVRLSNMHDDPRSVGFCAGHPTMTSFLGVPIQVGQQLFGILYLSDRRDGQPFSEQDEWLIETMAGYAALAIAGSHLREQQNRLILLEERERIGMELHDGVIQSLYALGMHLDLVRDLENVKSEDFKPIIDGLNDVIEDIRRYILNLKLRNYQQKTVYESLQEMLTRLHVPDSMHIEIDAPHTSPPFTPAVFESICQIANEALSNAMRHANAHSIRLAARETERVFEISVVDDGEGFNLTDMAQESGLGLRNIQQRARLYGGTVLIDTAPGKGTSVKIVVPL